MAEPTTIQIVHHTVDWNNLAWHTLTNLFPSIDREIANPGAHAQIAGLFHLLLRHGDIDDCTVFANPEITIAAESTADLNEFVARARRAQLVWYRRLRDTLGGGGYMKRAVKREKPLVRQLAFTGVLIIAGKHIHPCHWPDAKEPWGRKQSRGTSGGTDRPNRRSLLPSARDGESPEQLRDLANCPVQTEHRGSRNLGLSRQSVPAQEGIPSGKKDSPEVEVVVPKEQVTVVEERLGQGKVKEEVEEVVEVKAKNVTSVNSYGVRRE